MARKVKCPSCTADVPVPDEGDPELATYSITEKLDELGHRLEGVEQRVRPAEPPPASPATAPDVLAEDAWETFKRGMGG